MFVNKIGAHHLELGMNCQDYGFEGERFKLVCDGCSQGKHTEVGAKAYCHLASRGFGIHESFEKLIALFGQSDAAIKHFLCFTILQVKENDTHFLLSHCGDGYVILQHMDGTISFEELTDGKFPKYFSYNYCDSSSLKQYKDGVEISEKVYSKKVYANVGVASDGLRFLIEADAELKKEFIQLLKMKSAGKLKRFINRNQKICKDDITIVF